MAFYLLNGVKDIFQEIDLIKDLLVVSVTLLKQDGLDYLTEDIETLKNRFQEGGVFPIGKEKLLSNRYASAANKTIAESESDSAAENEIIENGANTESFKADSGEAPVFCKMERDEVEKIYYAIHDKLTAIGVDVIKELPVDINFLEGPSFYRIEIKPEPSTTLKKIKNAEDELNIALQLPEEQNVRIFQDVGSICS